MPPHDVLGLVAEVPQLRPHAFGLVPVGNAGLGEAGDLQRIGCQRQLSPVGENQYRRAVFEHTRAFGQLQVHPLQV